MSRKIIMIFLLLITFAPLRSNAQVVESVKGILEKGIERTLEKLTDKYQELKSVVIEIFNDEETYFTDSLRYDDMRMTGGVALSGDEAYNTLKDTPDIQELVKSIHNMSTSYFPMDNLQVEQMGAVTGICFEGTASSMYVKGDTIYAEPGSFKIDGQDRGEVNQFLCNVLPQKVYFVEDGLVSYETDLCGNVVEVRSRSSQLFRKMRESGKERNSEFDSGMKERFFDKWGVSNSEYDYGHLVRREIGGPNESINALPMKCDFQRSGSNWFELEELEVQACKNGQRVLSEMKIKYFDDHYEIKVKKVIDGVETIEVFGDLF